MHILFLELLCENWESHVNSWVKKSCELWNNNNTFLKTRNLQKNVESLNIVVDNG